MSTIDFKAGYPQISQIDADFLAMEGLAEGKGRSPGVVWVGVAVLVGVAGELEREII